MNPVDITVIAVIGLSALFGFSKGFVSMALGIAAWVGAALATIYGFTYAVPIAEKFIQPEILAQFIAGVAVFLITLLVLSVATSGVARRVKQSALSSLDRALGLILGVLSSVVVLCTAYLLFTWAAPQEREWPEWLRQAATRQQFLVTGADIIRAQLPARLRERGEGAAKNAASSAQDAKKLIEQTREAQREADQLSHALETPSPAAKPAGPPATPGYKPADRREMDRLFQNNQSPQDKTSR